MSGQMENIFCGSVMYLHNNYLKLKPIWRGGVVRLERNQSASIFNGYINKYV